MIIRKVNKLILYFILIFLGLLTLTPFAYMVSSSLKSGATLFEYPPEFLPANPTINNYVRVWTGENFQVYFLNSITVSVLATVITALLSSMLAFGLSRYRFRGQKMLFAVIMATMIIPGMTLIIPQYDLVQNIGLLNSLWGLIIVYSAWTIPFTTFLLKGFFDSIPQEMDEAVYIDGGTEYTLYWKIMLPLSLPALGAASIFNFLTAWEEFPWALTVITEPMKRTLPIAIANFQGQYVTEWGLVFAACLIAILPVI